MSAERTIAHPHFNLVGRDTEWRALLERCDQVRQGRGGLYWLAGEAGIGKTALMEQLRVCAEAEEYRVLWGGHIGHRQAAPLHGLRQTLSQLFGIAPADGPVQVEYKITVLLKKRWTGLELHRRELIRFLAPPDVGEVDLFAETRQNRTRHLYHLLFRLLATVARDRPLLLFLDDCHWADDATLDCLTYLAAPIADQPILLLGAYRPEEPDRSEKFAALMLEKQAETLALSRLDLDAVVEMATPYGLDGKRAFCEKLHRYSEGVPLFVEQWLLACGQDGAGDPEAMLAHLPAGAIQTISRRLNNLDVDELQLLRCAAVAGDHFDAELLVQVSGHSLSQVLDALAELEERHGLIEARVDMERSDMPFFFHHTLIRQMLYEGMPQALRQRLHGSMGAAFADRLEVRPELVFEVAHHYVAARQQSRAVEVLCRAGQRTFALEAYEDAGAYYRQALEAIGANVQEVDRKATIEEALGDIAQKLEEIEAARHHWKRALEHQEDSLRRSVLYLKLGSTWIGGDIRVQWNCYQKALKESDSHPGSIERAQVLISLLRIFDPNAPDRRTAEGQNIIYMAQALRILRRHPDHRLFSFSLTSAHFQPGKHNVNLAMKRRQVRRGVRLAERCEYWDLAIHGRMRLAELGSGESESPLIEAERTLDLADNYLEPNHQRAIGILHRLLQLSLAYEDEGRVEKYRERLRHTRGFLSSASVSYLWRHYPEQAWHYLVGEVRTACSNHHLVVKLAQGLTRLLRLVLETGRREQWRDFIAQLQADFPTYIANLPLAQWELRELDAAPDSRELLPGRRKVGVDGLEWVDENRRSRHRVLPGGEVEIEPSLGAGLAWGTAPCMLRRVEGDFAFETRIGAASHPRRAGGIVVWEERRRLIRFASGVDHTGQVSLGWHGGGQLRYVGIGYHPAGDLHMRLIRRGQLCEGLVSPDGKSWFSCGQLEFGDNPVEVGFFAESNYEYNFAMPFPTRFDRTALWLEDAEGQGERDAVPAVGASHIYPLPEPVGFFHGMVGQSRTFGTFCKRLEDAARSSLPLLLCGETGVGKELAAHAVHQLSRNSKGPYLPVNVAILPENLIESELFGHRKGAFTGATEDKKGLFAAAAGGTLFLDELGELPPKLQTQLLRVLDSGEIRPLGATQVARTDTRCVGATNRDLALEVSEGRFRQDLYFRFADPIEVPPLRTRKDDIPHIVAHFMAHYGQDVNIARRAVEKLVDHDWPDNIRGLKQVVERAVLAAAEDGLIVEEHLQLRRTPASAAPAPARSSGKGGKMPSSEEIQSAVEECGGNVAAISRHFGVSRLTIYRWIERYGLDLEAMRGGRPG